MENLEVYYFETLEEWSQYCKAARTQRYIAVWTDDREAVPEGWECSDESGYDIIKRDAPWLISTFQVGRVEFVYAYFLDDKVFVKQHDNFHNYLGTYFEGGFDEKYFFDKPALFKHKDYKPANCDLEFKPYGK